MIRVNQLIYKELKELGFLKEKTIKNEYNGKSIGVEKNYQVANRNKNSKCKTYFVQEDVYERYLKSKVEK